jgi:hypothetical protein
MQSKNIQHRGELGPRFTPFRNRGRGWNNSCSGKETHLIAQQLRTADRHHPLTVTFGITPADNAAEQFAIERLQLGDKFARNLMREAAQRRRRVQQARQRQGVFLRVGFTFKRRAEVPERRRGNQLRRRRSCSSRLRSRNTFFIACVTSSCSWRSFSDASRRIPLRDPAHHQADDVQSPPAARTETIAFFAQKQFRTGTNQYAAVFKRHVEVVARWILRHQTLQQRTTVNVGIGGDIDQA